jgi:hypothetical protein
MDNGVHKNMKRLSLVSEDNTYLSAFDELAKMVELMSGVRQRFIDQGWHPINAEVATLELVLGGKRSKGS